MVSVAVAGPRAVGVKATRMTHCVPAGRTKGRTLLHGCVVRGMKLGGMKFGGIQKSPPAVMLEIFRSFLVGFDMKANCSEYAVTAVLPKSSLSGETETTSAIAAAEQTA